MNRKFSIEYISWVRDHAIENNEKYVWIYNNKVNIRTLTLDTFFEYGFHCEHCNLIGEYFRLKGGVLTLYAVDEDGEEVRMTKDHVIPLSKGGLNIIENLQPMCIRCNVEKGNKNDNPPKDLQTISEFVKHLKRHIKK